MPLRPLPYQQASTYRNELVPLTDDEKLGHLRAVHKCIDVGPAESLLETQVRVREQGLVLHMHLGKHVPMLR